ncbi:MAG: SUMF1/EgtB/PvdO family nonheme iron enzyme [Polyangiaceae bacterium]|nr:SUMF1/EgtB/PvdO family nonheme iron enzyme [Polyangiaceae bacterium]
MVEVSAGPFLRGSVPGVGLEDEHPQRTIELSAFYIDRTEVTQADYARCVDAGKCKAPVCKKDRANDWDPAARATHPVVCIEWEEARGYCAFAGKRLPTEAEWEKAARGTDGRFYPWGNDAPTCERANYYECGKKGTVPVGSYPSGASPFGAHDMAGNVWEWTADFHMAEYYVASPAKDPEGPSAGESKIVRGGAFKYGASELLSAGRTFDDPTVHFEHVGVRCAKSKDGL